MIAAYLKRVWGHYAHLGKKLGYSGWVGEPIYALGTNLRLSAEYFVEAAIYLFYAAGFPLAIVINIAYRILCPWVRAFKSDPPKDSCRRTSRRLS